MRSRAAVVATVFMTALWRGEALASGPQIVVDAGTGEVVAAAGADLSWHPASLTKLMTAHLTLKAVEEGRLSMSSPVEMSAYAASQPPSKLGLPAGGTITVREALTAMLVRSSNDVAVALAETVAGSEPAFVALMNREAKSMGMSATFFVDPNGLDDGRQVSSARDLAVLALAILRAHPDSFGLFGLKSASVRGHALKNTNGLLGEGGVDGMKTGYVCASGFNIVATANRGGRRLLAVVLGESSSRGRESAAAKALDLGFSLADSGRRLASYAQSSPKPAMDLTRFACGRGWKGIGKLVPPAGASVPQPPAGPALARRRF